MGTLIRFLAVLIVAALCVPRLAAREMDEAALKAAFLYNFAQFVNWPGEGEGEAKSILRLCSHGTNRSAMALEALGGRTVRSRTLRIQQGMPLAELFRCDIVYLPAAEPDILAAALKATTGRPVLLVAEGDAAAQFGAVLSLVPGSDGRMGFDLNLGAARAARLTVSSRLIKLARRVY